jgi:hypothetical protein
MEINLKATGVDIFRIWQFKQKVNSKGLLSLQIKVMQPASKLKDQQKS